MGGDRFYFTGHKSTTFSCHVRYSLLQWWSWYLSFLYTFKIEVSLVGRMIRVCTILFFFVNWDLFRSYLVSFILFYTTNLIDVADSMIIDEIDLANKVNHKLFSILTSVVYSAVNETIRCTKTECSQSSVYFNNSK